MSSDKLEKLVRDELEVMVAMEPLHAQTVAGAYQRYRLNQDGYSLGEYLKAGNEWRVTHDMIEILNRILREADEK